MKTIYIDSEYKCHVNDDGTMTPVETGAFDGKCDTYIEGYRYIPEGASWIRKDGKVFDGLMIAPWKDHTLLAAVQSLYEETIVSEERIASLEENNAMLTECLLEMSEIVYA